MIQRIYADNFRSLTNFEHRPGSLELLIGENGSGKTTLFEVVRGLVDLVLQRRALGEVFPRGSTTRWERRTRQTFELDYASPEGLYRYSLVIDHLDPEGRRKPVIIEEVVALDGHRLFAFVEGQVQLYNDDSQEGPDFPFNPEVSFFALLEPRRGNKKAIAFKETMERIWYLALDPGTMRELSQEEAARPEPSGENFVDWYRGITQERSEVLAPLFEDLRPVIPGLSHLRLDRSSPDARTLQVVAETASAPYELRFSELSAGQRALVFYYTLLHTSVSEGGVLLLDEPDNFVALAEIQPWLTRFADRLEEQGGQAVVISHHPEVMDYLNDPAAWLFERREGGPVRARRLEPDRETGLPVSQLVARGWLDGE